MAKRTKKKNNKLSKRKYSRRRVSKKKISRRRLSRKKISRRRIYQKKYRGGAVEEEVGGIHHLRLQFVVSLCGKLSTLKQKEDELYEQNRADPTLHPRDGGEMLRMINLERNKILMDIGEALSSLKQERDKVMNRIKIGDTTLDPEEGEKWLKSLDLERREIERAWAWPRAREEVANKVFIFGDQSGKPEHLYEEPGQIQLRKKYEEYILNLVFGIEETPEEAEHGDASSGDQVADDQATDDKGKITEVNTTNGPYSVIINQNKEFDGDRVYITEKPQLGYLGWCNVTHEIGIQHPSGDQTKRRIVFVGDKYGLYPGDLFVVDEYPIIKNKFNKFSGLNSKTNLVFAAASKDSEPTYIYFISDELKAQHTLGADGKLLILKNPPKTPEEYKGRTEETQNVDGSTPSVPSLSGWRVKHWKPDHWKDERCPYDGGIWHMTYKGVTDYETPNGIILLFSPGWPRGNVNTQTSKTISFDGTSKIEPIKIILGERSQQEFNKLFKQLSIVTKPIKEIQRFGYPKADIVVSHGSVVDFGAGKHWSPLEIAIVNAANNGGLGGLGVDGAITEAGGPHLANDRIKLPVLEVRPGGSEIRIQTGDAVLTGPGDYGDLHAANVIHAVGPDYRGIAIPEGNILLQQAYEKSMRVAQEKGIKYIGFSLLSSGIFRGNPERISLGEVLKIGIDTVKANLYRGLLEVHFVAFEEVEQEALIYLLGHDLESGLGQDLEQEPEPEPEPDLEPGS